MRYITKEFNQLSPFEIYSMYLLRAKVFVVEQQCAYQDVDEKDLKSLHVFLWDEDILAGYCRIIPPGISYKDPSIGRVVIEKAYRTKNLGRDLVKYSLNKTTELFKGQEIVISAQTYLKKFYSELGFISEGVEYLEDDIPHVKMRKKFQD
jgi:ElaA protein